MIKFEWDDENEEEHRRKHGISFEEAKLVFLDPYSITEEDKRFPYGEKRYWTIGDTGQHYLLLYVAHTMHEDGNTETIRIISAREAEPFDSISNSKLRPCNFEFTGFGEARHPCRAFQFQTESIQILFGIGMKGESMAIVSCKVEMKPRDITWEEAKARLAAMPEIPESEINFTEDCPKLTEEQLNPDNWRPFWEILEERRAERAARKGQTVGVG